MIDNFVFIANLSNILPLAIFIFYYSFTKKDNYAKAIAGYCIYALMSYGIYILFPEKWNAYFDAANAFFEYLTFSVIIYFSLVSARLRKIVVISGITFLAFFIIYLATTEIVPFDPVLNGVRSIILFILAFLVFYERFQTENESILSDPKFWGLIGLIMFLGGSFLIYLVYYHYYNEVKELEAIPLLLYTLKSLFLSLSMFLLVSKNKKNLVKKEKDIPFLDLE